VEENVVTAVLKIEEEANKIVLDAKAKARQREKEIEHEISKIASRLQKGFNKDVENLKVQIQKKQLEEAERVRQTFEQKEKEIEKISPAIGEEMVRLVLMKLSEA